MGVSAQAAASGPRRLGRYELISKIAAGGMAEVFLARQHGPMGFTKVVVVKTIHEHLAEQQDFIDMFLDEARVSALIKHHNVVDIYDLGVEDGTYFIAMEYIPGQALSKVMSMCHRTGERLDVMLAVDLIAAAAHGLEAAHNLKGITGDPLELVHRDVSPGNILVSYNGAVKLVDFGVAKSLGSISSSQSSVLKGKIGYASPEQLEDSSLDRRSDVFSLGVVLWELLVCERLFRGSSAAATVKKILDGNPPLPSSKRPEVPPELDELVLKALARDRDDRFQTAGEMRAALFGVLQANSYHSDNEVLATFMSECFARERAKENDLIRQIAGASVEIELYEVSEPDEHPSGPQAKRAASPELLEFVIGDGDDDDDDIEELDVDTDVIDLLVDRIGEPGAAGDDSDDEVEISIEAGVPADSYPSIPQVGFRLNLRLAGLITGGVLALALIAALVAGGGGSEAPAASAAEAAEARAPDRAPAPEPAPVTEPDDSGAEPASGASDDGEPRGDSESGAAEAEPVDAATEATRLSALGDQALAKGYNKTAKTHYKKALDYRESYPPALRGLALVYARAGRGKSARYYLNRYLRAAPNATDANAIRRRVFNSVR